MGQDELVVIQVDRDTAADVVRAMGFSPDLASDVRDGHKDYTPIVQAFARHRIASERAVLEQAAKVADDWEAIVSPETYDADEVNLILSTTGHCIAQAIRSLTPIHRRGCDRG